MTEAKKQLGMTMKQQRVMAMIIELLKEMPTSRIRGIHAHLDAKMENRPCHSLVTATIQVLAEAKVLELIEFNKAPGQRMKSGLYQWHQGIFISYEIVTIKQRPRKVGKKPIAIEPVVAEEETPEDYYTALCRLIPELEREYALLGEKIAARKSEKAAVDESIANVRSCFAGRMGK
ncbi:MAG: hypothetical protein UY31_C0064G0011 [Candidatus Wolfebacteria bacterium GW2011_GWE1_48_7]|uniref:Uncharacterized protein n=1 Tax=Candidatus Wolfebacteria bacterium GW2011_GWB1_47_1 TaxID=1619007 RepID=A0A0G4AQ78_9BACT|nr:MAG: hypothetical protein UX70_C0001G0058 [Candidatus Wolfebacteria bacterium GW2011_GWB1_47_1]KKU36572.1 MAG: hypothetical protein UX49_C0013G0014 [Candidatus Wolfebacteria bacterium GW2011_GWC2_46_275]KKU41706.1 MAG: hypothetical protein UX58_C0006G0015 [Candidatus Wolfebacteria bacterium GW2011_GWB2_46_69]KKU54000.1 MAG: hypothetical protein UX76_C0007G0059 [Candidatus Wolfebacteria bacterium GW2011_GWC1_47_103]KKU58998.1 MAG: hypothetical protein UX83_C0009G0014 [Candidatus Wolfebacteria